jgi:HSP20 family protein
VAFVRWDPLGDLLAMTQSLDRFAPGSQGWTPPVDVQETPAGYVITAELPGMSRDDVRIDVRDGRITLSGERREPDVPCQQYHRLERGRGAFSRSFQLPEPIDEARITADLRDGVLTITCPKVADPRPRRVAVSYER